MVLIIMTYPSIASYQGHAGEENFSVFHVVWVWANPSQYTPLQLLAQFNVYYHNHHSWNWPATNEYVLLHHKLPWALARVYYSIKVLALAKWLTASPARFKVWVRRVDYIAISGSSMFLQTQMDRSENEAKYFIGSNCSTTILCGWQFSGCEVLLPACILSLTPHSDHGKQDIMLCPGLLWRYLRARIENISYQSILWTLSLHECRAEAIWL